jgi:hypothetical protein
MSGMETDMISAFFPRHCLGGIVRRFVDDPKVFAVFELFNPYGPQIRAAQLKLDLAERRERRGTITDTLRERGMSAFKDGSRA